MRIVLGLLTPLIAYAFMTGVHVLIPVARTKGYVRHETTGQVLHYRINGKFVLWVSIAVWWLLGHFGIVAFTWLYDTRWYGLMGACVIGLAFSVYVVVRQPPTGKRFLADFWFGREKDPQIGDGFVDAKLWVYMIGAVMLQLNVLSCVAHHLATADHVNPGFLAACAMLTWFCWDYLTFEKVHLWTYDFIAERFGFKLAFGCLAFYPYFYAVALWFTAGLPNPGWPAGFTLVGATLFLFGWVLTRGANMQKYFFRTAPGRRFLWFTPEALTDGDHALLVNGYWGVSRHINYLGEIIQALAVALVIGYPGVWAVWLYPVYYVGLLFSRQADDDKVCAAKYGPLWDEYTEHVKRRIIPFLY